MHGHGALIYQQKICSNSLLKHFKPCVPPIYLAQVISTGLAHSRLSLRAPKNHYANHVKGARN